MAQMLRFWVISPQGRSVGESLGEACIYSLSNILHCTTGILKSACGTPRRHDGAVR